MAVADVILSINSKLGPGGMASLQAAGQMIGRLGRNVIGAAKEMEKFSQVYQRVELGIGKADAATKGLIDTMALFKNSNKAVASGAKFTEESFRDVALVAADFAKKMGTDVTSEFNKLMDGITKGSTRSLKPLGIDLKDGADLAELQADALAQVAEKAKGLTIEVETLSESMFVLNNNWDTTTGLMFDWVSGGDAGDGLVGKVNSLLGDFNNAIMNTNGGVLDFMDSGMGYTSLLDNVALKTLDLVGIFGDWTDEIEANNAEISHGIKLYAEFAKAEKELIRLNRIHAGMMADKATPLPEVYSQGPTMEAAGLPKKQIDRALGKTPKGGGGGGGGGVNITRGEAGAWRVGGQAQLNQLLGPAVDAPRDAGGLTEADLLESAVEKWERLREERAAAWAEEQERHEISRAFAREDWEQDQVREEWRRENEQRRAEWWAEDYGRRINSFEMLLGVEQNYINESTRIWQSGLQGKLSQMEFFFGAVAKLQNVGGRKMFNLGKAAAYAENIFTTALMGSKSYNALAGIPFAGPALGAGAAASAIAFGAVQGNQIRSAQYGGGGGSAGAASIPSIDGGGGGGGGGYTPGGPSGGGSQTVVVENNISLVGGIEGFLDVAVEENHKRGRHGQEQL